MRGNYPRKSAFSKMPNRGKLRKKCTHWKVCSRRFTIKQKTRKEGFAWKFKSFRPPAAAPNFRLSPTGCTWVLRTQKAWTGCSSCCPRHGTAVLRRCICAAPTAPSWPPSRWRKAAALRWTGGSPAAPAGSGCWPPPTARATPRTPAPAGTTPMPPCPRTAAVKSCRPPCTNSLWHGCWKAPAHPLPPHRRLPPAPHAVRTMRPRHRRPHGRPIPTAPLPPTRPAGLKQQRPGPRRWLRSMGRCSASTARAASCS